MLQTLESLYTDWKVPELHIRPLQTFLQRIKTEPIAKPDPEKRARPGGRPVRKTEKVVRRAGSKKNLRNSPEIEEDDENDDTI